MHDDGGGAGATLVQRGDRQRTAVHEAPTANRSDGIAALNLESYGGILLVLVAGGQEASR